MDKYVSDFALCPVFNGYERVVNVCDSHLFY